MTSFSIIFSTFCATVVQAGALKFHLVEERIVVVESLRGSPILDEGSTLVVSLENPEVEDGSSLILILGKVFEIFGPVAQPLYTIRLPSDSIRSSKHSLRNQKTVIKGEVREANGNVFDGCKNLTDLEDQQIVKDSCITDKDDAKRNLEQSLSPATATEERTANQLMKGKLTSDLNLTQLSDATKSLVQSTNLTLKENLDDEQELNLNIDLSTKNAPLSTAAISLMQNSGARLKADSTGRVSKRRRPDPHSIADRWSASGECTLILRNLIGTSVLFVRNEASLINTIDVIQQSGKGCGKILSQLTSLNWRRSIVVSRRIGLLNPFFNLGSTRRLQSF